MKSVTTARKLGVMFNPFTASRIYCAFFLHGQSGEQVKLSTVAAFDNVYGRCTPGGVFGLQFESYRRRLRSLSLYLCYVFRAPV